jgi:glycosyltransferase involved in cell wall biosynthesis
MSGEGERMRVLVVGFVESIHAVRAVEPMTELGWDVHVFSSHPHWANPAWRDVTLHVDPGFVPPGPDPSVRVSYLEPAPGNEEPVIEGLTWGQRVGALAQAIEDLRPDLVDSMEIQHGGYLVAEARSRLQGEPPPWLVHNWGSDVFYYGRNPRHQGRLRTVLSGCDFYGAECHRDIGLARAFGFSGKALPVLPNAGGFDLKRAGELRAPGPSSARRTIALKATDAFVYRPQTALAALELCADLLDGYTLSLYTASPEVEERARRLCQDSGLGLEVMSGLEIPVTHEQILALHGRSRISLSLSESDAICTSFLEAMVMGSFPIQSDTGCSAAWADPGRGALFVDPDDPEQVAAALRRALDDDALVDAAAERNAELAVARLDRGPLLARMRDAYERVAAEVEAEGSGAGERGLDPAALAARLPPAAADSAAIRSGLRRERLALMYLDPAAEPEGQAEELLAEIGGEEGEAVAADLVWALERQAELLRGERVGWARGEVGTEEQIDGWYDSELVERDEHIAALRRHVRDMQRSLDGFHARLEIPALPPFASRAGLRARLARARARAGRRPRGTG